MDTAAPGRAAPPDDSFGYLPRSNGLLGTFLHAPRSANAGSRYFDQVILTAAEHERRKQMRHNVFSGQFHISPGDYSDLHNLARFRSSPVSSPPSSPKHRATPDGWATTPAPVPPPPWMRPLPTKLRQQKQQQHQAEVGLRRVRSNDDSFVGNVPVPWGSSGGGGTKDGVTIQQHERLPRRRRAKSESEHQRLERQRSQQKQQVQMQQRWRSRVRSPQARPLHPSPIKGHAAPVLSLAVSTSAPASPPRHQTTEPLSEPETSEVAVSVKKKSTASPPRRTSSTAVLLAERKKKKLALQRTSSSWLGSEDQNPWAVNTSIRIGEKYELLEGAGGLLGRGTFSEVKTAVHQGTGRQYALKMVKKRYLCNREEKEMLQREMEIQQVLRHRNIVRLYEIFEDEFMQYLVLERATSGSLEQLITQRGCQGVGEPEAFAIFIQLLRAVGYLHDNGVLHGDIKPSNVLLTHSSRRCSGRGNVVKLCDFGLSRKVPDVKFWRHTGSCHKVPFTQIRGTFGYLSPELLRKEMYGIETDMWALGVILYELVSGSKPFLPYTACLDSSLSFPSVLWENKGEALKDLLSKLLVVEPDTRIEANDALVHSWILLNGLWEPTSPPNAAAPPKGPTPGPVVLKASLD